MFSKRDNKTAYVFHYDRPEYPAIHNFFVFYPIDVIYLDRDYCVVVIKKNIKPFTPLVLPPRFSRHFIEIASGNIKNVEIGDFLKVL